MKRILITIYIILVLGSITIPFGVVPIIETIFKDAFLKGERDLGRGTFALIEENLEGLDDKQQDVEIKRIAQKFGYPINIYLASELNIAKKDLDDFNAGLIIIDAENDRYARRLKNSNRAVTMGGPFPLSDIDLTVTILFGVLFLLFLSLPFFAWAYFLQRDLKKIQNTTAAFASGKHSTRVKVSKISSFSQIASSINDMADQTQKLLESQKDLANSVSHEIRTPLARIKFSLEMLTDYLDTKKQGNHYIDEVGKDVEEIESLVDEILTYAKFDRESKFSKDLEQHEMLSWMANIIKIERKIIPDKTILFITIPESSAVILKFEPVYLGWAIRNLIRNASKYAKQTIYITIESNDEKILTHVDDDGPGIPEEVREKIFEPFFRLDKSRNRNSGNYGLGLSIARRISLWHQGSIEAGLSPLGGARFTITLPVKNS
jgi:signal transduction histidine kinase